MQFRNGLGRVCEYIAKAERDKLDTIDDQLEKAYRALDLKATMLWKPGDAVQFPHGTGPKETTVRGVVKKAKGAVVQVNVKVPGTKNKLEVWYVAGSLLQKARKGGASKKSSGSKPSNISKALKAVHQMKIAKMKKGTKQLRKAA